MSHWKHTATRCAVASCERTRVKGWSTCATSRHYEQGVSLYGLGRGEPRLVCAFCKGQPVGNAAAWIDVDAPLAAACPRCGERH
jgi:hypothetical protein